MPRWLPFLLLLGCQPQQSDRSGTFVGNPGKMDVGVSEVPEDIALDSAAYTAASLELVDCEGVGETVPLDVTFDALTGREDAVEVPGGAWCEATLRSAAGALVLEGSTSAGTTFTATLDPGDLLIADRVEIDGTALVWSLPLGALSAADIDALGPDPVIAVDDPIALDASDGVAQRTGLYQDLDGDGLVSTGDFLAGAADPSLAMADDSSAGCGCNGGAGTGPWALLTLLLLARRRRHRATESP